MIKRWIKDKARLCFLGAVSLAAAAGLLMTVSAKEDSFVTWSQGKNKNEVAVALCLQEGEELDEVVTFQVKFHLYGDDLNNVEFLFDGKLKNNKEIPVKEAIYDGESGILSVYVSGRETVLSRSPLKLGTIKVDSGKNVYIEYLEDSGLTVDRFHTSGQITKLGKIDPDPYVIRLKEEDTKPAPDENEDGDSSDETGQEPSTETSEGVRDSSHEESGNSASTPSTPGRWQRDGDNWLFVKPDGTIIINEWVLVDGKWYRMDENGHMQTGWIAVLGTWYFCGPDGAMRTGWVNDGLNWYYCDYSGAMKTGWITYQTCWYYMQDNGAMKTGWQKVNGRWYYLEPDGKMAADTITPDGYRLDRNGIWIP